MELEAAITACCKNVLNCARQQKTQPNFMELEVRLRDVSEPFFNRVAAYMADVKGAVCASEWQCADDFMSTDGLRTTRHCTTGVTTHMRKTRLAHQDLAAHGTGEVCSLRMSLALEEPVIEVPYAVTLTIVRRKLRRSLLLKNWRLDITKVWTGDTLAEVQRKHVLEKPGSYEIEVESLNLPSMLQNKTDAHIAHDALLKAVALFKTEPRQSPLVLQPL